MNKFILIFISISILSCSKDDSNIRVSNLETPILTGFLLRNITGDVIGKIGFPNIKLGNESNDNNSEYFFSTYPNPIKDKASIYIKSPNTNTTKKVWIVHAEYNNNISNAETSIGNATLLSAGGSPIFYGEISSNDIHLDLSNLNEGYYRVYVNIDGLTLYDNLIITNTELQK